MAEDVPAREVAVTGDCGFKGNGGGARSGSELSHLLLLSLRQRPGIECDCLVRGLCPYIVLEDGEETRLGKKKDPPLTWAQEHDSNQTSPSSVQNVWNV